MVTFRIPELTKPYMEYDMIKMHTDLPSFPELSAKLLFLFLNYTNQQSNSELFTLATSLVQLGLDTHNLVSTTNLQKEKVFARGRQLKVLAGDYFSSRFYYILAQAGQVNAIKQLADSICEVNRMKLNLYLLIKQLKITAGDYLDYSVNIRIQLFLSFKESISEFLQPLWPGILRGFIQCEFLISEIMHHEKLDDFQGSWAFWHILQSATKEEKKRLPTANKDELKQMTIKYNTGSLLESMLEEQHEQILLKIKQLGSEKLMNELEQLMEPISLFLQSQQGFKELMK